MRNMDQTQAHPWQIVEAYSAGVFTDADRSEDQMVTHGVYAIIDGDSNSPAWVQSLRTSASVTTGRMIAEVIADELETLCVQSEDAHQVVSRLTYRSNELAARFALTDEQLPHCSVVVLDPQRDELWILGRGHAVLEYEDGARRLVSSTRLIDQLATDVRVAIHAGREAAGLRWRRSHGPDPAGDVVHALLDHSWALANDAYELHGYGIINGFDVPEEFLRKVSLEGVREVVLTSRGYPSASLQADSDRLRAERWLSAATKLDPEALNRLRHTHAVGNGLRALADRSWLQLRREL